MPANRRLKRTLKISRKKAEAKGRRVTDAKAEAFVQGIEDAAVRTGQKFSPAHIMAKARVFLQSLTRRDAA